MRQMRLWVGRLTWASKGSGCNVALSSKQQAFVDEYLRTWNATKAAIAAGYSEKTAGSQGFDLLKKPEIQGAIKERLESKAMAADEVLARFAEQARFDATPYLIFEERYGDDEEDEDEPNIVKVFVGIDVDKLRADGLGHLLKSISKTRGGLRVEWQDSQKALELIGKHLGLFRERIEHSGPNGAPLPVPVVIVKMDLDEI